MKVKYAAKDSGRTLINNLSLVPGVEYTVTDNEVRYADGVTVIGQALAEKLLSKGLLEKIDEVQPSVPVIAVIEKPRKDEPKEQPAPAKEG